MSNDLSPQQIATPRPGGRHWAWLALVVVFGVHSFLSVRLFPTLESIVEPNSPVVVVNHAIHEYHGSLGARFLRESGTTWGYDPNFMAGYPETPVWDSSSNPSILLDWLGGGRGYRAYKVGLLAMSILMLVALAGGAWASGLGLAEIAMASALASFAFWTGFSNGLWRSGLFAFVTASASAGLLLGLCTRFDRSPTRGTWLALVIVGSGLFFFHVTGPILAIGGLLAFYVTVARRHGWRWHAAIVGAGLLAVVVNLFWLIPLWRFRVIRTGSGLFMTTNSARFLLDLFLQADPEGRASLVMLILGTAGLVAWWFGGLRGAAAAFGGSILALMLLTGFGSLWETTKTMEPLRFRVSFLYLLTVPAASAVVWGSRGLARWMGGKRRGTLAVGMAWVSIMGTWAAIDWPVFKVCWLRIQISLQHPLVVGIKPEMSIMVDWLRKNTDLSGRILFEDQLRLLEITDAESVHWTPLLPQLLGSDSRMFIGGLYQTAFIKHHQMASFGDFQLGNRYIDEWTPLEVQGYCETYNVGWVVCWSPLSRHWFDHFPLATRVATLPRYSTPNRLPPRYAYVENSLIRRAGLEEARRYINGGEEYYAIYRIDRPHSYFLKGKGRIVSVEPNRIELADVEPDQGAVVLSLHWLDTWRTDPPLKLTPEPMPPDPVEFVRIEVDRPMPRVVLSNSYQR